MSQERELDAISVVVHTYRRGTPAARRRLTRAIELVSSATDGRHLECVDVRLSQLERDLQNITEGKPPDMRHG